MNHWTKHWLVSTHTDSFNTLISTMGMKVFQVSMKNNLYHLHYWPLLERHKSSTAFAYGKSLNLGTSCCCGPPGLVVYTLLCCLARPGSDRWRERCKRWGDPRSTLVGDPAWIGLVAYLSSLGWDDEMLGDELVGVADEDGDLDLYLAGVGHLRGRKNE